MWIAIAVGIVILAVVVRDIFQKQHTIQRNFPIIGHFRYWLEAIGPELRQYIVSDDNEEKPFSRAQRRWIYASSKRANNYFGFGTDNDLEQSPNFVIIKHSNFPLRNPVSGDDDYDAQHRIACEKVLGEHRDRAKAFRPRSIINISAMSFGSLSGPAIEALNRGAELCGCLHNTGEGGISPYHQQGGDLVLQLGTAYFGCRDADGRFSMERLVEAVEKNPVRAIEIKLSQGAKPGVGGLLPAAKITDEIARVRGIRSDRDCASPAAHSEFDNVDGLLDFVERIADETGLPVGIKSAVGQIEFWQELTALMATTGRGVDFVTVDGSEGGTGAAPLVFADHVALPFKIGMNRVYGEFFEQGIQDQVVFVGSGKLGFPQSAYFALGMGCDLINVGREAMMSIGCIQAQRCHTGHCPAGIATQNKWLMRGLDPTLKSARLANYIVTLRSELLRLSRACGLKHPADVSLEQFEILDDRFRGHGAAEWFTREASRNPYTKLIGGGAPPLPIPVGLGADEDSRLSTPVAR